MFDSIANKSRKGGMKGLLRLILIGLLAGTGVARPAPAQIAEACGCGGAPPCPSDGADANGLTGEMRCRIGRIRDHLFELNREFLGRAKPGLWYETVDDICERVRAVSRLDPAGNVARCGIGDDEIEFALAKLAKVRERQCRAIELVRRIRFQEHRLEPVPGSMTEGLSSLKNAVAETVQQTEQQFTDAVYATPRYYVPLWIFSWFLTTEISIARDEVCRACDYRDTLLAPAQDVVACLVGALGQVQSGVPLVWDGNGCKGVADRWDALDHTRFSDAGAELPECSYPAEP